MTDAPDAGKNFGLFPWAISLMVTSIFAGMILDGGVVSGPSIICTWVASVIVMAIVVARRGATGFSRTDRLLLVLCSPVFFFIFTLVLPPLTGIGQ